MSTRAAPKFRRNTLDLNGNNGLYYRLTGAGGVVENNLITRSKQGLAGDGRSTSRGYNNAWLNANDVAWTAGVSDTDISSDPEYLDPLFC